VNFDKELLQNVGTCLPTARHHIRENRSPERQSWLRNRLGLCTEKNSCNCCESKPGRKAHSQLLTQLFKVFVKDASKQMIHYSYSKTNYMHQCIKFIYFRTTLYMFRTVFPVHHQEYKTVRTATGICQTDSAVCLLAVSF